MKKTLFLLALSSLLFGCKPTEPTETVALQSYSNAYYGFSLEFTEDYSYCLNDYCINTVPEDAIGTFSLMDANGVLVASIQPYVNLLNMSALDFGKRSLELNREYSQNLKEAFSGEQELTFAGEDAYSFVAEGGFEERGGIMGMDENSYIALLDNSTSTEPMLSVLLEGKYRVFYLDHGKYFFRIVYLESDDTEKIIESFQFLKATQN